MQLCRGIPMILRERNVPRDRSLFPIREGEKGITHYRHGVLTGRSVQELKIGQEKSLSGHYTAFCTLPDFKQLVQTLIFLTLPLITARTLCKLGNQRLRVLLFAWLILFPLTGPFPQISQTRAIMLSIYSSNCWKYLNLETLNVTIFMKICNIYYE